MPLKAYHEAQRIAENPRSTEYRLFGQVTGALIDAQREGKKGVGLIDAIDWNRRMWSTLAIDCMDEKNMLSRELKAQIVSLSIWVGKYSSQVVRDNASIDPLIDVNRTVMQGLATKPEAA